MILRKLFKKKSAAVTKQRAALLLVAAIVVLGLIITIIYTILSMTMPDESTSFDATVNPPNTAVRDRSEATTLVQDFYNAYIGQIPVNAKGGDTASVVKKFATSDFFAKYEALRKDPNYNADSVLCAQNFATFTVSDTPAMRDDDRVLTVPVTFAYNTPLIVKVKLVATDNGYLINDIVCPTVN